MLVFFLLCGCTPSPEPITKAQLGTSESWAIVGMKHQVQASSSFFEGVLEYPPIQASDGNPKSAWCAERADTQPTLEISDTCAHPLRALYIHNGFAESARAYKNRKRIKHATLTLRISGAVQWHREIEWLDQMGGQFIPLPDIPCTQEYHIILKVHEAYPANGPICLAELQVMHDAAHPPEIVSNRQTQQVECRPKTPIRFFAGPSTHFTQLGVAAILLTEHGAPYLRVVETQGGWARVDRIRRQFLHKENPPTLKDPKWGGWVKRDLLECLEELK